MERLFGDGCSSTVESEFILIMASFAMVRQMAKITAVLDQETWVSVDTPDEFQDIVESFIAVEVDVEPEPEVEVSASGDLGPEDVVPAPKEEEGEDLDRLVKTESGAYVDLEVTTTVEVGKQENGSVSQEPSEEAEKRATEEDVASQAVPSSQDVGDTTNDGSESAPPPPSGHSEVVVSSVNGTQSTPAAAAVQAAPPPLHGPSDNGGEVISKTRKTRDKPSLKTLHVRGQSYHAVNWCVSPTLPCLDSPGGCTGCSQSTYLCFLVQLRMICSRRGKNGVVWKVFDRKLTFPVTLTTVG